MTTFKNFLMCKNVAFVVLSTSSSSGSGTGPTPSSSAAPTAAATAGGFGGGVGGLGGGPGGPGGTGGAGGAGGPGGPGALDDGIVLSTGDTIYTVQQLVDLFNSTDPESPERTKLKVAIMIVSAIFQANPIETSECIRDMAELARCKDLTIQKGIFNFFVERMDKSARTSLELLRGLSLIMEYINDENGATVHWHPDDLIQTCQSIRKKLEKTHFQVGKMDKCLELLTVISNIVDAMVDCETRDVSSEDLKKPLREALKRFKTLDPEREEDAVEAAQKAEYISAGLSQITEEEREIMENLKTTYHMATGLLYLASGIFKLVTLDAKNAMDNLVASLESFETAATRISSTIQNSPGRNMWYQHTREIQKLSMDIAQTEDPTIQEGKFAVLERKLSEIRYNEWQFVYGVVDCLAAILEYANSQPLQGRVLNFLKEIYKDNKAHWGIHATLSDPMPGDKWGKHKVVRKYILNRLMRFAGSTNPDIREESRKVLKDLTAYFYGRKYPGTNQDNPYYNLQIWDPNPEGWPYQAGGKSGDGQRLLVEIVGNIDIDSIQEVPDTVPEQPGRILLELCRGAIDKTNELNTAKLQEKLVELTQKIDETAQRNLIQALTVYDIKVDRDGVHFVYPQGHSAEHPDLTPVDLVMDQFNERNHVVVSGPLGSGKRGVAYQVSQRSLQKDVVYWVNGASPETLEADLRELGNSLSVDIDGINPDDFSQWLQRLNERLTDKEALLVVENAPREVADQPSLFGLDAKVLYLTEEGDIEDAINLLPLNEDCTREMVRSLTGQDDADNLIFQLTNGNPLAIKIICDVVKIKRMPIRRFYDGMKDSRGSTKLINMTHKTVGKTYSDVLRDTMQPLLEVDYRNLSDISDDHIRRLKSAKLLLHVMALIGDTPIPDEFLSKCLEDIMGLTEWDIYDAKEVLGAHSLFESNASKDAMNLMEPNRGCVQYFMAEDTSNAFTRTELSFLLLGILTEGNNNLLTLDSRSLPDRERNYNYVSHAKALLNQILPRLGSSEDDVAPEEVNGIFDAFDDSQKTLIIKTLLLMGNLYLRMGQAIFADNCLSNALRFIRLATGVPEFLDTDDYSSLVAEWNARVPEFADIMAKVFHYFGKARFKVNENKPAKADDGSGGDSKTSEEDYVEDNRKYLQLAVNIRRILDQDTVSLDSLLFRRMLAQNASTRGDYESSIQVQEELSQVDLSSQGFSFPHHQVVCFHKIAIAYESFAEVDGATPEEANGRIAQGIEYLNRALDIAKQNPEKYADIALYFMLRAQLLTHPKNQAPDQTLAEEDIQAILALGDSDRTGKRAEAEALLKRLQG